MVKSVELVQFELTRTEIFIEAQDDAMALLLSGQPIGEPVVGRGPFVMNTHEEIRQTIFDYQDGRMVRLH